MPGPLTPPPSSAIEIQDATRSSVPPDTQQTEAGAEPIVTDPPTQESVPTPAPQAAPQFATHYHILFPSLAEIAGKGDFQELARLAERGDLNADNDDDVSRLLVTAPLVLSYLILDNLPPARFALQRLPFRISKHPLGVALLALVSAVWEKYYDQVYARAGDILVVVQKEKLVPDYDLGSFVAKLVNVFIDTFQRKTFALLSKAYSTIPLPLAQTYLGMQAEQLLTIAAQYKWSFDAGTQVLSPIPTDPTSTASTKFGPGSSLATFNSVADSLILESW